MEAKWADSVERAKDYIFRPPVERKQVRAQEIQVAKGAVAVERAWIP